MSIDWYRQRLGRPAPSARPHPVAPQPAPKFVIGPDGRAYPLAGPEEQPPDPGYQPQLGYQQPGVPSGVPSQVGVPIGQIKAGEAINYWKGTAAAQKSASGCPSCGSPAYFAEYRAGLQDGMGGESGKLSLGQCPNCGYGNTNVAPLRTDANGFAIQGRLDRPPVPTQQPKSLRGIKQGQIPIEAARQPYTPEFQGLQNIVARVG